MRLLRSLSPIVAGLAVCLLLASCGKVEVKQAILASDTAATERILKAHPDQANSRDADGDTMLHVAIQKGDAQVVRVLLRHGADVNATNSQGEVPLEVAAYQGSATIMKALLAGGAKLVSPNALLARAAWAGNVEVARLLVDRGADVNGGATPGSKDKSSPLHSAVVATRPDMVEFLITNGADVNVVNATGQTPLHLASGSVYTQIVRILLDHGAKVEAKMPNGETALHKAATYGRMKMVEVLLNRGADVNAKTADERTPLDCAAMEREIDTVAVLRQRGGKPSKRWELSDAVIMGDKTAIARILTARPSAATELVNGQTPLHLAVQYSRIDSAEILIAHKVDVNGRCSIQQTPLHLAVRHGNKEMTEFLIAHGAEINPIDKTGLTPLGYLYHRGPGARPDVRSEPPSERYKAVEKVLLAHGAKDL